ncbi:DUF2226 domain-containing protein [Methanopyrus sp. KOL6]|uniref:DUF2226 domain-containing protein n=1 Tax=Methanopyrus sp. KOL6 TaxID=1937004 RepID=UPI001E2F9DF4|nr:DUF2226 domain-containing protein [Methanopyrus sp. KOL6]
MLPKTLSPVVKDKYVESLEELADLIASADLRTGVVRITSRSGDALLDAFIVVLNGKVVYIEVEEVRTGERWRGEEALERLKEILSVVEKGQSAVVDVFEASEEDVEMIFEYHGIRPKEIELDEVLPVPVLETDIELETEKLEGAEKEEAPEETEIEVGEVEEAYDEEPEAVESYDFTEELERESESLSREEILKKYGIKEPDESFVKNILKEFTGVETDLRERISRVLRSCGITVFKAEGIVEVLLGDDTDEEDVVETIRDFMKDVGVDELEVRTYRPEWLGRKI